jgi:hypothetical protein
MFHIPSRLKVKLAFTLKFKIFCSGMNIFHQSHYLCFIIDLSFFLSFFLSLAPQPSLGLGLLHKIRLNFSEASQQFSFLQGRVVSPTPNPHPGGPGLCIYIPQRQGGYPF